MDFEQWMREQLAVSFRQADGSVPSPRYASAAPNPRRNVMLKAFAALAGSKVALAGTAVVALAGTGVAVKAAATGDPNPTNWGSQVTQQVQTCKAELSPGQHGIGQCVSNFAKQHGKGSAEASPSPHGHSSTHPTPRPHPTGKPAEADHPTPPAHPTGSPEPGDG